MSMYDFSRDISKLKSEKKFDDALAFFKANKAVFAKEQIASNEYIVSDMLYCLRGAKHFDAGFKFLSIYSVIINESTPERILTAYGWLLCSKYKSENAVGSDFHSDDGYHFDEDNAETSGSFHYQKSDIIVRVEQLIPLLYAKNSKFCKSVRSNLFNIVLKSEKKKPSPSWQLVDEFCGHFSPDLLSTECSTIKVQNKGREKDMELASDKENWYAYKTKALQKLGMWQECFDLSKQALDVIQPFHYSNDVWFSRRIALSKKNLGSPEETIDELLEILKKKKEWFIQKELAELYLEKNNIDLAHKYAIDAINNFGPLEFKIDLLFLMGKIYLFQDKKDLAFKHFSLSKLVRMSQDPPWKVPQKLSDELRQLDISDMTIADIDSLKAELKRVWNVSASASNRVPIADHEKKTGVIKKILHENERGKDGFLTYENKDYHFKINVDEPFLKNVILHSKVLFKNLPSTDLNKPRVKILKIIE